MKFLVPLNELDIVSINENALFTEKEWSLISSEDLGTIVHVYEASLKTQPTYEVEFCKNEQSHVLTLNHSQLKLVKAFK